MYISIHVQWLLRRLKGAFVVFDQLKRVMLLHCCGIDEERGVLSEKFAWLMIGQKDRNVERVKNEPLTDDNDSSVDYSC